MTTSVMAIMLVLAACVVGAFGALGLKLGSAGHLHPRHVLKNYKLLLGLFLYGVSTVMFIPALKYGDLSVLYPLTSATQVWVVILSVFFLKEKMNTLKWAGIVAIIIGVTLISIGG
jgi:uncharacterized membrane protein